MVRPTSGVDIHAFPLLARHGLTLHYRLDTPLSTRKITSLSHYLSNTRELLSASSEALYIQRDSEDEPIPLLGERDRMNDIWKAINQIAGGHSNLRLAIHKKEDLDEKNDDKWTPYMWAVRCGLQEAADELKYAGADTSGHFDAALLNAVFNNDLQKGIHALKNGANPNRRFAGSSIIGCAASHGLDQLVAAMIAHGAEIESEMLFEVCHWETADWKVDSQEHVAAFANVVRAFLNAGADPNIRNADGKTPLEAIEGDGLFEVEAVLRNAQQAVTPNA